MKNFKELIASDVTRVFMNQEEFGEKHIVDGKTMTVLIDAMEVVERSKKQLDRGRADGVYEKQILLYVSRKDFGPLPTIGRQLKLDKGMYRIADAVDEGGIYSITLGVVRS